MADRLSIDRHVHEVVIPLIDKSHFLHLDATYSSRIELFVFASAIGVKIGYRTPLNSKIGLILNTAISDRDNSLMYSLATKELCSNNQEEKISDLETVQNIFQEYANTGFLEIEKMIKQMDGHYEPEKINDLLLEKLGELEGDYESLNLENK